VHICVHVFTPLCSGAGWKDQEFGEQTFTEIELCEMKTDKVIDGVCAYIYIYIYIYAGSILVLLGYILK
jgi:hypothetical protein